MTTTTLTRNIAPRAVLAAADKETFTPEEIARMLGVDPEKVRRWLRSGELVGYDLANNPRGQRPRYRVTKQALEEFLARRAVVPPTPAKRRSKTGVNEGRYY